MNFGALGSLVSDIEASSPVIENKGSLGAVDGIDGIDGGFDLCFSFNLFLAVLCQFFRPSMTRSAKIDSFTEEPI